MASMTVADFISALGSKVQTITYDTTQTEGVILSDDGLTANVYNVAVSGEFSSKKENLISFPNTLVSADLRGLDTSGITDFTGTFLKCSSLTSLNVSNWNTSNGTAFFYMFCNCSSLTSLDVSNWNTSSATDFTGTFLNCSSLTSLDLSNFSAPKYGNFSNMFAGCSSLTSLDLSNLDTSKYTMFSPENMFKDMNGTQIKISDKWTLNKTSTAYGGTNLKFVYDWITGALYLGTKKIAAAYLGSKKLSAMAIGSNINNF